MTDIVHRREFLRQAAVGVAVLSTRAAPMSIMARQPRSARATRPQKIIVVGAGMAGLAVALELSALGHDVTILEARARPGGRVLTLREPFADGLYAEAGAMQVFDTHHRVQRYIQQLGLELDAIRPPPLASVTYVRGQRIAPKPGERVAWPFELRDGEKQLDSRGLWEKYVVPELGAVTEAEASGTLLSALGQYDRITFSEFLRQKGASAAAVAILNVGLPSGLGDGGDHVSALDLLREAAHRQERKQSFTIRGGTDRLPRALAARVADRIHYGTPVIRIEQNASSVRAVALQGKTARPFAADRLVCTIPFSVLRRVEVGPSFTPQKRAAIAQLEYTSVARVFVQTRTRFWVDEGLSGNASTDLPVMGVYERTINQAGTRGILESYTAGANARRLTQLSERDRLASVLAGMAKVFPRIADQYEGGASKSWDDDEWSRGAYAWFRPGQMTAMLPHIASAEGRIHFAGEHTSSSPGWMEGALESAERVTREIDGAA